jgi:D-mannonate dehydratase
MDNGYMDMYKVMKALVEVKFDGIAIPDHIPGMGRSATPAEGARAGARTGGAANSRAGAGLAYSIAYMRALLYTAPLMPAPGSRPLADARGSESTAEPRP